MLKVQESTARTMIDVLRDIVHNAAFEYPSNRVGEKAAKLVDDECIEHKPRRAIIYTVKGETDFYRTTLYLKGAGRLREIIGAECPCEARWQCSHVLSSLVRAYQDGYRIAVGS